MHWRLNNFTVKNALITDRVAEVQAMVGINGHGKRKLSGMKERNPAVLYRHRGGRRPEMPEISRC